MVTYQTALFSKQSRISFLVIIIFPSTKPNSVSKSRDVRLLIIAITLCLHNSHPFVSYHGNFRVHGSLQLLGGRLWRQPALPDGHQQHYADWVLLTINIHLVKLSTVSICGQRCAQRHGHSAILFPNWNPLQGREGERERDGEREGTAEHTGSGWITMATAAAAGEAMI